MSAPVGTVHVVAAVIQSQDRVMVAQRRAGGLAGKWEFPGGKVRTGESPTEALQREIMEEFSVAIEVGDRIDDVFFSVGATPHLLTAFFARHTAGAYQLRDHSRMEWIRPRDLVTVDLAPADIFIAGAVRRMLA
jgi:8-oxo-dGTP diphosphatase